MGSKCAQYKKYFELSDSENTVYHNLWVEAKVLLRGTL